MEETKHSVEPFALAIKDVEVEEDKIDRIVEKYANSNNTFDVKKQSRIARYRKIE